MSGFVIHQGSAVDVLPTLAADSVDCVVTSPPYWGLRDYGVDGQIGLEPTPAEYVARMVEVFREVRRVLKDDGTLWLNLGDSYASTPPGNKATGLDKWATSGLAGAKSAAYCATLDASVGTKRNTIAGGLKPKDLCGIPWRVAFALQADGWYLRSDIIWSKPNPMPESVEDRPTKAHEYLFLLAKSRVYHYDADAIREPAIRDRSGNVERRVAAAGERDRTNTHLGSSVPWENDGTGRNRRDVWTIPTEPFPGAHFAVMPTALVKPCVLAGCRPGGTVLDPFTGSGTVGFVAHELGCEFVGIEINPEYVELARKRIGAVASAPLLPFGDPK